MPSQMDESAGESPVPGAQPAGTGLSPSAGSWAVAAALFALAAGLRVIYVLQLQDHPRFDAPVMDAGYHLAWAQALAEGAEFREGPFFRAPLYPIVLGALLKITGGSLLWVRIFQALLGGATAAFTYRLGVRVAGEWVGRAAGLLVAFAWILVAFDAELLIPTLLLPLVLLALDRLLALGSLEGRALWVGAVLGGVCFGLAAITRPNVLLFMPLAFVGVVGRARRLGLGLALTLGTLLPILPVTAHNVLEGDPALIATQGGVNFWIGNNPASDGAAAIVPGTRDGWWEGYFDAIAQAEALEGRDLNPTEVSAHYTARAFDWTLERPADALRHFCWKARLFGANAELANNQDMEFLAFRTLPVLRFSPYSWGIFFGFGIVGLLALIKRRAPGAGYLGSFALVYSLSVVLFFVNARFRLPIVPILAIGTGATLHLAVGALRSRRIGQAAWLLLPSVLIAGLAYIPPKGYVDSDAAGLRELGVAELARGNAERGLAYLEEAIRMNPSSVQVRMALATAVVQAGKSPERALLLLEEAKELPRARDFPGLDAQLLDTAIAAGMAERAVTGARAALATNPRDSNMRFVLGRALAATGKGRAAVEVLEALLKDEPTQGYVAFTVAKILEGLGTREEALAAFSRVVDLADFVPPFMAAEAREKIRDLSGSAGQ